MGFRKEKPCFAIKGFVFPNKTLNKERRILNSKTTVEINIT